jgi:hypothetical protein
MHHDRLAVATARRQQQSIEYRALASPPKQHLPCLLPTLRARRKIASCLAKQQKSDSRLWP